MLELIDYVWRSVSAEFFTGLGIPFGLILFAIAAMLWMAIAGPLQEWLMEATFDRWRKRSVDSQPEPDGRFAILVSDLHIDTWKYEGNVDKSGPFLRFLDWVVANPDITDFYINGDLCDVPPFPLNQENVNTLNIDARASGEERYPDLKRTGPLGVFHKYDDQVFEALATLSDRRRAADPEGKMSELHVTYVTGNHDIGVSGMRWVRPDLPWGSVKVAWNPCLQLKLTDERWTYIEHGHQHDPFLWIYLRYAILELLRDGTSSAQRRGKVGMLPEEAADEDDARALTASGLHEEKFQPPKHEGFLRKLVRLRFRQAARRLYRQRRQPNIRLVTFGHTHLPDRYEFPGGREYINSGDWAGNDNHQCYLKIYENGIVTGPHQWK